MKNSPYRKISYGAAQLPLIRSKAAGTKGGKGPSICDVFDRWRTACRAKSPKKLCTANTIQTMKPLILYSHYKEDIKLFAEMGFKCFHTSIARTRIFPKGDEAQPNEEGLKFYDDMIDELLKYNIEPVISPTLKCRCIWLQQYGSWTNRKVVDFFCPFRGSGIRTL